MQGAGQRLTKRTREGINIFRQDMRLLGGKGTIFRKSPVATDANRNVVGAQIDTSASALIAGSAQDVWITGHPLPDPHVGVACIHDQARKLVPQHFAGNRRKLAFEKMPVGATDPCRLNRNHNLAGLRRGIRHVDGLDITRFEHCLLYTSDAADD